VRQFIADNPDAIVICNDISSGVVPVDAVMRKWREAVGRTLAALSQKSDEVIRLFCGIPARIK
jgi:adenosyl cobinamide kinase/adenosyl cobinamide phosphate guanylyltransferase